MKKSFGMYIASLHYNTKGRAKGAVFIYHHFIITRKDKHKFWYVSNIALLKQGRTNRGYGMYISSPYYNKER